MYMSRLTEQLIKQRKLMGLLEGKRKNEFRQIVNNSHGHWISKKVEKNELIKL